MILRYLFTCILILLSISKIYGALNVAKLNSNLQQQQQHLGDSKQQQQQQHRHSMDQLEPDLAKSIFGGIQRNPLERTTTAKPKIVIVKSPTLRGKRDTLPDIQLADVKILGNDDPLPEQSKKAEVEYENINADFNEDSKSEAVEATTSVDFIIDETADLSNPESEKEKIIDSELAVVTSEPVEAEATTTTISTPTTTVGGPSGTTLIQEVAAPTQKYNLTQNDNSPTENLDRKILAFEIDSHNRKIFEELQKKKSAAIAAKKLEDPEFSVDEEETKAPKIETTVSPTTTTITPVFAANEVQIDESKKLLNEVSFDGSPKISIVPSTMTTTAEQTMAKEDIVAENAASEFKVDENVQTTAIPQQPNEMLLIENANESIATLTADLQPTQGPIETNDKVDVIPSEVSIQQTEAPIDIGTSPPSEVAASESSKEDRLKHQTEVPAATPFTEAAFSKEVISPASPSESISDNDSFINAASSEQALRQAALLAEANAAKVGAIQFPSQLPSIFYEKASQRQKLNRPAIKVTQQQQQPEQQPDQQVFQQQTPPPPPPPPPPSPPNLPGFLIPNRPILDSTVQKRRHLISNYIDPIQLQKALHRHQKQEFFRRSAVIARERSKRESNTEQPITYDDEIIDEADSGEANLIVRLTKENSTSKSREATASAEAAATTMATTTKHQLKLMPRKNGSKKHVLDHQVHKSTVIHENPESTTPIVSESLSSIPTTSESETSDIQETTTTTFASESESETSEKIDSTNSTTTSESSTTSLPEATTTKKPSQESLIAKALTREEKLALLESSNPRAGINLGKVHAPTKVSPDPVDASAEISDPENPWTHRFKSHIQLKLNDESREVVDRTQLKILPKLISPQALKEQKKAESEAKKKAEKEAKEFEFKDLPEPHNGDLKVDVDVVTKPSTKAATLIPTTVIPTTTKTTTSKVNVPNQSPQLPASFLARPSQQFQQPILQPQGFQQSFQQPQQQQQFFQHPQQQQSPQSRIIIIDGIRYLLREPTSPQQQFLQPLPQQFFQPQQQFQQQPQSQQFRTPSALPLSHSPPPSEAHHVNSPSTTKPQRIIHSGNAKQIISTTPPSSSKTSQGPRVNPDDLSVVRIFQHKGTTRQIFATTPAPTTLPITTTILPTPETTEWIPVTFTTHPTPTAPFDILLVTTPTPIPKSRVRTHNEFFDVYDEVELASSNVVTPKKAKKKKPSRRIAITTSKTIIEASDSDFEDPLISEVGLRSSKEQQFRDIPLRHPPHDPPVTNFDYSDGGNAFSQRKSSNRKMPKLVRLNNPNAGTSISQKPATDFMGDVPIAKFDLRGLDKKLASIS
uniref:Uncharacterized protein n=1 Tax=Panagrolaimus sp. ES5 TaxID=591445 RepID=A0AC34F923_9BILA